MSPFRRGDRVVILQDPLAALDDAFGHEDPMMGGDAGRRGTVLEVELALLPNLVQIQLDGEKGAQWFGVKLLAPLSAVDRLAELDL